MIVNSFRWFRESTGLICSQAKHVQHFFLFIFTDPDPWLWPPFKGTSGHISACHRAAFNPAWKKYSRLQVSKYRVSLYNHIFQKFFLSIMDERYFARFKFEFWMDILCCNNHHHPHPPTPTPDVTSSLIGRTYTQNDPRWMMLIALVAVIGVGFI